ncbi:hypothetical protein ACHAW5_000432 [Stephanodiscus triporus]|uniref:Uncharacterized protein n=1 Tax=Stephanodiscus triporus TaxID=2934178 RepID=A0ABD3MRA4_9STRA
MKMDEALHHVMLEGGSRMRVGNVGDSMVEPKVGARQEEDQGQQFAKFEGCKAAGENDAENNRQLQSNLERRTSAIIDSSNIVDAPVEYLPETLGGLAELWEQRLAENRRRRGIDTENDSATAVPTTICTSSQMSDHASVTSSDAISTGPPTRRGNVRFGNMLSPFASSKNNKVLQRDQTIHELEAVICSNIEVIRRIKCAIEEIDTPVQGNTSNSTENIAQLKDALLCLGSEGGWCASAEILNLQTKVKVLESTIFMQGIQQETLKKDLTQLNERILDMEAQKSCQEDEIESLKARVVTLELSCRLKDDSIASLEEALNTQSKCNDLTISNIKVECEKKMNEMKSHNAVQEDQIRSLRAEIRGLHEEKRNAMEEMKKDLELADLERE